MSKKYIILEVIAAFLIVACSDVVNVLPESFSLDKYVLEENTQLPPSNFAADNVPTVAGVKAGRMLFYDPILSGDSSQSCGSCHNQEFGFTDNGKQFSEGIDGSIGTRNSMPIFNLMWHRDGFFWDGRSDILRHQALIPIQDPTEMNETISNVLMKLNRSEMYKQIFLEAFEAEEISEDLVGLALEQFMSIIVSGDSKFDKYVRGELDLTDQEKVGQIIFNEEAIPNDSLNYGADCFHCHGETALFMSREYMSNGLDNNPIDKGYGDVTGNATDVGTFKVPSLRNIALTAPYMHDGRFNTIDEVIDFYLNGVQPGAPNLHPNMHALKDNVYLKPEHKAALVAFLHTLTDSTLINNKDYSNPF